MERESHPIMKEIIKHKITHNVNRLKTSLKWVVFAILSGVLVGSVGTLFYLCMEMCIRDSTQKSYKLSVGLRTQSVECSKLGKTWIITDASCGMVRNTGFCVQNLSPHVYLELLSIYFL